MAILTFTTFEDVRGVLGVTEEEVDDVTLSLNIYDFGLQEELEDIGATLPSEFVTVAAVVESSRTDDQQRFFRLVQMFSTYAVAKQLASSLPLFAPQSITDSKATMARFTQNPYEATVKEIDRQYGRIRERLLELWSSLQSLTGDPFVGTYILSVPRGVDRITGQ